MHPASIRFWHLRPVRHRNGRVSRVTSDGPVDTGTDRQIRAFLLWRYLAVRELGGGGRSPTEATSHEPQTSDVGDRCGEMSGGRGNIHQGKSR